MTPFKWTFWRFGWVTDTETTHIDGFVKLWRNLFFAMPDWMWDAQ